MLCNGMQAPVMTWQNRGGCQREHKSAGHVIEFPLLDLAARSAEGTAGRHVFTFMSLQGQRKLLRIVWIALKSFQVYGSAGGALWPASDFIPQHLLGVRSDSWELYPRCCLSVLAEATGAAPYTPAGDATAPRQIAAVPPVSSPGCKLPPEGEWACRGAGGYTGGWTAEPNQGRELQEWP